MALPDVHARVDPRGIALSEVGVRGVAALLVIEDSAEHHGPVATTAALWVALSAERRGGHLSRFGEALAALQGHLAVRSLPTFLADLAERLEAHEAGVRFEFPLVLPRAAPLSGAIGEVRIACVLEGKLSPADIRLSQEVTVSVQTLCPCSKEMADRGAHNQRCALTARVRVEKGVPFRELIGILEAQGSAPLFPVLKRIDEKALTERAYDHPAFVEDVVRDAALALRKRDDLLGYKIEARSQESIHPHDAYAIATSVE